MADVRQSLIDTCKVLLQDPTRWNVRQVVALLIAVKELDSDNSFIASRKAAKEKGN